MERTLYLQQIRTELELFPVVALLGPRQVGKTTLARQLIAAIPQFDFLTHYLDSPPCVKSLSPVW